jgi:signal transduction histidine kinase
LTAHFQMTGIKLLVDLDPAPVSGDPDQSWRGVNADNVPGGGIGLTVVAQIAAAHGRRVSISPRAGGGTLAEIALSKA